jgi:hypothetical protein
MPTTLRLIREGTGIELRRGTFNVLVDGQPVRSINHQETIEVPIQPGHHTLQIRSGRYSSRSHTFDALDDMIVNYRCHGPMMWPRYIASILKPDMAISLRRE